MVGVGEDVERNFSRPDVPVGTPFTFGRRPQVKDRLQAQLLHSSGVFVVQPAEFGGAEDGAAAYPASGNDFVSADVTQVRKRRDR